MAPQLNTFPLPTIAGKLRLLHPLCWDPANGRQDFIGTRAAPEDIASYLSDTDDAYAAVIPVLAVSALHAGKGADGAGNASFYAGTLGQASTEVWAYGTTGLSVKSGGLAIAAGLNVTFASGAGALSFSPSAASTPLLSVDANEVGELGDTTNRIGKLWIKDIDISGSIIGGGSGGAHAATHQHGGADEVAVAVAAANAIPKADGAGTLAVGWIPSIDHTTGLSNAGTNTHAQIDTHITAAAAHIADATIHFTEASIAHGNIGGSGTNTHSQIDTHLGDTTHHFTEASIDHANIANVGTNTHAQIDTHVASTSNPHGDTLGQILTAGNTSSGTAITLSTGDKLTAGWGGLADLGLTIQTAGTMISVPSAPVYIASGEGGGGTDEDTGSVTLKTGDVDALVTADSGNISLATGVIISGSGARGSISLDAGEFLLNGGSVGIGVAPAYDLDVAGDINLTGDVRLNGVVQSFGGAPGGSPSHIQYHDASGSFAGDAELTWLTAIKEFGIAGNVTVQNGLSPNSEQLGASAKAGLDAGNSNHLAVGAGAVAGTNAGAGGGGRANSTAVGFAAIADFGASTAVGSQSVAGLTGSGECVAVGYQAEARSSGSIALGAGALADTNDGVVETNIVAIGSGLAPGWWYQLGQGDQIVGAGGGNPVILRTTSGSGADDDGQEFILRPGLSTGGGQGGRLVVKTSPKGTPLATTLNAALDRFSVEYDGEVRHEDRASFKAIATPAANTAGYGTLYVDSAEDLHFLNSTGDTILGAGGGGGGLTVAPIQYASVVLTGFADQFVPCDPQSGPVTLTLPLASVAGAGARLVFKDFSGVASTINFVHLEGDVGDTIDGLIAPAGHGLTAPYQSIEVWSDGAAGWWIR